MLGLHRFSFLVGLGVFAAGCSTNETIDPGVPDGATDTQSDSGALDTSNTDTAIDTFVPHTPKAPRCVIPDGGTDLDSGATDTAASDTATTDDAGDAATDDATSEAGDDAGDAAPPPLHMAPLQAVTSGGKVLHHAHVVPITYDGDPNRDDVEDFTASFGCTSWWATVGREYGVYEATGGDPIHLADKPPDTITDKQIEKWMRTNIAAKAPGWELPGPETVYAIWYPSTTLVKLGTIESCSGFGGFHKNFSLGDGTKVAYAVMVDCGGDITGTTSHEFIEAATDPFPVGDPAYQQADDDHLVYWYQWGGEVGDLCERQQAGGMFQPKDYPFVVQRSWSNIAAANGHDPCVPSQVPVYFNTIPELPDTVSLNVYGSPVDTKGIKIAVGESKTIYLQLVADGPIVPWNLTAKDASGESPHLTFSFEKTTGSAGDRIALTITKKSESATLGAEPFSISSNNGKTRFSAYGVVGH
ncbi:MAG: hypothetical protein ACXWUG_15030 [Polyangiales bacterium]